jgi:hypothetical protein
MTVCTIRQKGKKKPISFFSSFLTFVSYELMGGVVEKEIRKVL